eukprot:COSAG01_NODE_5463_length_4246_cov_39.670364_4_plen_124_part_00
MASRADYGRNREAMEQLLSALDDYEPTIPDELVTHYLSRSGFTCPDNRVKRLIGAPPQTPGSSCAVCACSITGSEGDDPGGVASRSCGGAEVYLRYRHGCFAAGACEGSCEEQEGQSDGKRHR